MAIKPMTVLAAPKKAARFKASETAAGKGGKTVKVTVDFPVSAIKDLFDANDSKISPAQLDALFKDRGFLERLGNDLFYCWDNDDADPDDKIQGLVSDDPKDPIWKKLGMKAPGFLGGEDD